MSGATPIASVSRAMRSMKAFGEQSIFYDGLYDQESRQALSKVPYGRMEARVSAHLNESREHGVPDRRNGNYSRRILTGAGDLELRVPETRCYNPVEILERHAGRTPRIDRMILAAFVPGLSTRKVGKVLLQLLGETVSASTVSAVARQLDAEVAAWRRADYARPAFSIVWRGGRRGEAIANSIAKPRPGGLLGLQRSIQAAAGGRA